MRISRGCTTVASAIAGFVIAMRHVEFGVSTSDRPVVTVMRSTPGPVRAAGRGACAMAIDSNPIHSARSDTRATRGLAVVGIMSADNLFGSFCGTNRFHAAHRWRRWR